MIIDIKLNYFFFYKNFKNQEKEAGTDFFLLSRSRKLIW